VQDAGDGTYLADITSDTCRDTPAKVSAVVEGVGIADIAEVTFFCLNFSPDLSTLTATPGKILANGVEWSQVTVTPIDQEGGSLGSGLAVEIASTLGDMSEVTDLGDGTYTALLTSDVPGEATVSATVDGEALSGLVTVLLLEGDTTSLSEPAAESCACGTAPISLSHGWIWMLGLGGLLFVHRRRRG